MRDKYNNILNLLIEHYSKDLSSFHSANKAFLEYVENEKISCMVNIEVPYVADNHIRYSPIKLTKDETIEIVCRSLHEIRLLSNELGINIPEKIIKLMNECFNFVHITNK